MIPDLPRFPGIPDRFIAAINERLRALTGTASSGNSGPHRGTGPGVPPSGGTVTLRVALAGSYGQVGVAFNGGLIASDGTAPYTYLIAAGSLPPGLSLSGLTGAISGVPTTEGLYEFTASVTDTNGDRATAACTINIAMASGASSLIPVVTVTGRDMGHATDTGALDTTRLVSFSVGVRLTFDTVPTQYCTVYISRDDGTLWCFGDQFLFTAKSQEIDFQQLRPATAQNWKVAAVQGTYDGDPSGFMATASLPAGTVFSSSFAVAALSAPGDTQGTNPTPATGAGGNWPYNKKTADGSQYWSIPSLNIDASTAYLDPDVFVIATTFQDIDASGNPIGPEHLYGMVVPTNGQINIGKIDGDYGTDGYSYIRTGNIASIRWRQYAISRADQSATAWQGSSSTLLTDVGGGAGYVDVLVAQGGALPPGKILVNSRADATVWGGGVQVDPTSGSVVVPNNNPGASVIQDPSFQYSTAGVLGSGGMAPNWNYSLGYGSTAEIKDNGGNSETKYVRLTGGDAAISQTISVQAGLKFYVQVAARSSNTGGAAHAMGIYVDWLDSSRTALSPYTDIVGTVSGYVSSWTNPAVSGYLTAPTNAAFAIIKVSTAMAEPGYWDVDDLLVQPVVSQQTGGVTVTTDQSSTGYGTAVFKVVSATASGYYGQDYMQLVGASAGEAALLGPNSLGLVFTKGSGGLCSLVLHNDDNTRYFSFVLDDALGAISTIIQGGVTYNGINGTFQDNAGVNHTVKAGLIVT